MKAYVTFALQTGKTPEIRKTELPVITQTQLEAREHEWEAVCVYPGHEYQTFEGCGTSLTESACVLLSRLSEKDRRAAMSDWFGQGGVDSRFVRMHIDSCDYSVEEYQAVADPIADPELATFDIGRDKKLMIPAILEANSMSGKKLEVMLSPWSPPAAWKTLPVRSYGPERDALKEPSRIGGRLKREYYGVWAKYLVKYVAAYLDAGVPVTMLTPQNEPYAETDWDSCLWTAAEQREFLAEHLYPEMERAGLAGKVGIYAWDFNKDTLVENLAGVVDQTTRGMLAGAAYHWYSGDHFEALDIVRETYPGLKLVHSESCMLRVPVSENDLFDAMAYAHDMIGDLNHGMERWIDWNLLVDRRGGPRHVEDGFGAPMIYEDDGTVFRTLSWEFIRLFSDIVRPGSVRLGVSAYERDIDAAAVRRPDGCFGALLLNHSTSEKRINLRVGDLFTELRVPAKSLCGVRIEL